MAMLASLAANCSTVTRSGGSIASTYLLIGHARAPGEAFNCGASWRVCFQVVTQQVDALWQLRCDHRSTQLRNDSAVTEDVKPVPAPSSSRWALCTRVPAGHTAAATQSTAAVSMREQKPLCLRRQIHSARHVEFRGRSGECIMRGLFHGLAPLCSTARGTGWAGARGAWGPLARPTRAHGLDDLIWSDTLCGERRERCAARSRR
eukprot:776026-Prymnesium_polylepis.1